MHRICRVEEDSGDLLVERRFCSGELRSDISKKIILDLRI